MGAAMYATAPVWYGILERKATRGVRLVGRPRAAPLGVPVVPDVRMIWRPGLVGRASLIGAARVADVISSSIVDDTTLGIPGSSSALSGRNSSSRMIAVAPSLAMTAASWGAANPVLR